MLREQSVSGIRITRSIIYHVTRSKVDENLCSGSKNTQREAKEMSLILLVLFQKFYSAPY